MNLQSNAKLNFMLGNTTQNAMEIKRGQFFAQVVADLAVAEGREGEYKAGIYQFPIDYTKVLLCSSSDSLNVTLTRRTTAMQSTRAVAHWWTWQSRLACCSCPVPPPLS